MTNETKSDSKDAVKAPKESGQTETKSKEKAGAETDTAKAPTSPEEGQSKAPDKPVKEEKTSQEEKVDKADETAQSDETDKVEETAKGAKTAGPSEDGDVLIEVKDLTKMYGDFAAVDHISFQVRRGEVVGFLGPNGAGKTTTMRMLTCLLAPTDGRAKVAGFDTLTQSMDVRRSIGYLPEDTPLYENMSVLEFLRFAAEARDVPKDKRASRIKEVCEVAGLNSVLGRAIGHLSKGYRQRVGLAQAMVHDPSILILDEPWTGLDPNQISDVRNLIKKLGENKTLLLSTHILAEVEAVCDRVIIIDRGKIKADGSPEDVVREFGQVKYEVRIKEGKDIDSFKAEVQAHGQVESVQTRKADGQTVLDLVCAKGKDLGQEAILDAARKAGLAVASVNRISSSLEDVFRSLTVGDRVEIGKAA